MLALALVACGSGNESPVRAGVTDEPDVSAGRSGAASGGSGGTAGSGGKVASGGSAGTAQGGSQAGSGGVPDAGAEAGSPAVLGGSGGSVEAGIGGASGGSAGEGGTGGSAPVCTPGQVFCDSQCKNPNPIWGCDKSCQPCPWSDSISGGGPVCVSGQCQAECPDGWQSNSAGDGCELVPCSAGEIRCDPGGPCATISIFNGCGHPLCQPCPTLSSACCIGNVCGNLNSGGTCL